MSLKVKRSLKLLLFSSLMFSGIETAIASSSAHGSPTIANLQWPVVNASIYLIILIWIYKKHLRGLVANRADKVQGFLDASKQLVDKANEYLKEVIKRRDTLELERSKLIAEYEKEGERTSLQIIQNAYQQVKSQDEATERQIASELNQAQNEIRSEVVIKAIGLAKRRLQSEFSYEQDKQLRAQALDYLI